MNDAPHPRSHRILDGAELVLWSALLVFGCVVAWEVFRYDSAGSSPHASAEFAAPSDLIEAEDLHLAALSRSFSVRLQPIRTFSSGRWSGHRHLFVTDTRKGDWLEFELPGVNAGRYRLDLFLTRSYDHGIVVASLNGQRVGGEVDLWFEEETSPTGAVDLGPVELGDAPNLLRITVIGTNPRSSAPFYRLGVDGLRLTPLSEQDPDAASR